VAKLAVETKPNRFAVLTTEVKTIVERYPNVPRPVMVLVKLDCVIFVFAA
jgi:hypothetical protein